MRRLSVTEESWPLHEPFVISRMRVETAETVLVEIEEAGLTGRGEADRSEEGGPRPRVAAEIERVRSGIEAGIGRTDLASLLPAGPARNALDCALWDLEAKRTGRPAWQIAGLGEPAAVVTAVTIGLAEPAAMGAAAARNRDRPLLKLKLGRAEGDIARVEAVRAAAPEARLTVDANTGWTRAQLADHLPRLRDLGVELVEQPLPPGRDTEMEGIDRVVPVAADESCTDRASLGEIRGRYDLVNVKLDKAGGLTEALALAAAARAAGLGVMVGCNLGTSLAMAPALLLADGAAVVDLDGPLLLAEDREPRLRYEGSRIHPADRALWG